MFVASRRDLSGLGWVAMDQVMNGALDSAVSLARALPYRAAPQADRRLRGRDVVGVRPHRGADGATSDVCARSETP